MVEDEHDFVCWFVSKNTGLQIAFIDADDEGKTKVVSQWSLWNRDFNFLALIVELKISSVLRQKHT